MKKYFSFLLAAMTLIACNDDEMPALPTDYESAMVYFSHFIDRELPETLPEGWYREEIHHESYSGGRCNRMCVVFLDHEGRDLFDKEDKTTWPVPLINQTAIDSPSTYYDQQRGAGVGKVEGHNHFQMMAPVTGTHVHTFPLLWNGKEYEMKITYLYSTEGVLGGCCYAHILRWELDGHLLYTDFKEYSLRSFVYVVINDDLSIDKTYF